MSVAGSADMKSMLNSYNIESALDYETPMAKATISSFLLWAARRRNIAGASIWTPVRSTSPVLTTRNHGARLSNFSINDSASTLILPAWIL